MKPLKGLFPLASWLMRSAVVFFVFINFWNTFIDFNLQSVMFYVATLFIVFTVLLFVGGFTGKNHLTVISSLVLVLLTAYHAFLNIGPKLNHNFAVYILLGSVLVYFLTTGNKK